ncbi:ABC transporter permease [Actinomycetaceae bacterium L2_0104]
MKRDAHDSESGGVGAEPSGSATKGKRGKRKSSVKQRRGPISRKLRDQLKDVAIELSSRLSRTILMISAVAFSTGALLASVGISQNAAHQIDADIAASAANLVLVTVPEQEATDDEAVVAGETTEVEGSGQAIRTIFPADTEERLERIDAVDVAGLRLDADVATMITVDRPAVNAEAVRVGVKGASSGYLEASDIEYTGEHVWMLDGKENVAYLGTAAAEELGIPVTDDVRNLSVEINNTGYSIIGFLPGEHAFSTSLVIPYTNALQLAGDDNYTQVLIRTALGAGSQVSGVARLAILPGTPEKLAVSQVISQNEIRENVSSQLTRQATWVGAFLIVLTILLITNSMIVSVTARTTEIGVRRALGASRSSVAGVFWCEGALIGALGGLAGAALAAITITAIAALNGWTAYLSPMWIGLGPVLGMTVGLVASAYPAMRAATIHPAIAVRSD